MIDERTPSGGDREDPREAARRKRNFAIALGVGLFMAIIYAVTIVKLGFVAKHPAP